MKTRYVLFLMMCLPVLIWGQEKRKLNVLTNPIEVTPPQFTGTSYAALLSNSNSPETFEKYLNDNIVYPVEALYCLKQGTVVVQFTVKTDGKLDNFSVINSVCPLIDNELIWFLKTTDGMWNPGSNNGKPVEMVKEISVMYVASEAHKNAPKEYFTSIAKDHFFKGNNFYLKKHKIRRALTNYNESVKFLPYDASSLLMRGLCKYDLGDIKGARGDWERINAIGNYDADEFINNLCYLPGYEEMIAIVKK